MKKVLFYVSNKENLGSIKEVFSSINQLLTRDKILFECKEYNFKKETILIEKSTDIFLTMKYFNLTSGKPIDYSVAYIPDSSINLHGNYIWYSQGSVKQHVMIISSFIFFRLIHEDLNLGAYLLLVYAQLIARLISTKLEKPHDISRNCLNDHCAHQREILNVLNNDKEVLCQECLSFSPQEELYNTAKKIVFFIRDKYYKKAPIGKLKLTVKVVQPKVVVKPEIQEVGVSFEEGNFYEFEIFMAKKCINLSELYKKIYDLLNNPDSEIDGYSLYEVEGGWRGKIDIPSSGKEDLKALKALKKKHGSGPFRDLIKPIIEKGDSTFAIFDEGSIVLKIIIKSKEGINPWDLKPNKAIREITELFKEITNNEKSIFFTVKALAKVGSIKRI